MSFEYYWEGYGYVSYDNLTFLFIIQYEVWPICID
jgi:hypothetical protein